MHSSQSPPLSSPSYSIEFNLSEVTLLYAELFVLARNKNSEEDIDTIRVMLDKIKNVLGKRIETEYQSKIEETNSVVPLRNEIARLEAQLAIYESFIAVIEKDTKHLLEQLVKQDLLWPHS